MPDRRTIIILGTGFCILACIYLFQQVNIGSYFFSSIGWKDSSNLNFIFNKTGRLLLNDAICFVMICALFSEPHYRKFALWVFVLELFIILPVYLLLKLTLEGDSEISNPLLSFIHRLIVNPMLMILAMIALGYQKYLASKQ